MPGAQRRPAATDFYARRRLLLALAAAPLAATLPGMSGLSRAADTMTVGEVIAWLHLVAFRSPSAPRHG